MAAAKGWFFFKAFSCLDSIESRPWQRPSRNCIAQRHGCDGGSRFTTLSRRMRFTYAALYPDQSGWLTGRRRTGGTLATEGIDGGPLS
jgi:hypothetical protein